MMRTALVLGLVLGLAPGCLRVRTDPVEVKPIHITIDVNLRIQKDLDDFFGDIDSGDPTMAPKP